MIRKTAIDHQIPELWFTEIIRLYYFFKGYVYISHIDKSQDHLAFVSKSLQQIHNLESHEFTLA